MDFDRRLSAMQDRRLGISKLQKSLQSAAFAEAAQRAMVAENYQRRTVSKATRYSLGAMEQVKPEYTATSVEEAERVGKQLISRLPSNWHIECELQGSVPLNVHIEGVSDVDMLALRTDYFLYDPLGPKANTFNGPSGPTGDVLIAELRRIASAELSKAFPACDVDASGAKSLCMTGGSLRRKVDVVPSMWRRTAAYQAYGLKKDKGVVILDTALGRISDNLPFLHIHEVHSKDARTRGGTKKVSRLLKNLKADSDDADKMTLSSYEIAGLVWHVNESSLNVDPWMELTLLAVIQQALQFWRENKPITMNLPTPDGTRKIIQDEAKFRGLQLLSLEVDRLSEAVAAELQPALQIYPTMRTRERVSAALREAFVGPGS